jgi:hypothetical protein
MKKINLAKALKEKNRLVGEINRLKAIIERENSREENSTSKVDCKDLWDRLANATEALINIKTSVFKANANIYDKIVRMGELKNCVEWIKRLNTQDGVIETSASYTGVPVKHTYTAFRKQADIDNMVDSLQGQIALLQDDLDVYNATTEIEI